MRSSSERSVPERWPQGNYVVLEEVAGGEPAVELLVGEEPVVDAVLLARPPRARVVAETASRSWGTRASNACTIVPLPAPDGPVRTKTGGF